MGGGTGGVGVVGGSAGSGIGAMGGTSGAAGSGPIGGTGGAGVIGPYDPRSGPFKMLVSSQIVGGGYRHDSITAGRLMLQEIAEEKNFEVKFTENTEDITPEGLAQYEVVFFLNTAGDLFSSTERLVFEDWITTKNGGFVGVHSAADTAASWTFYKELTGQYHDLHTTPREADIEWEQAALNHPAVRGLPSPWTQYEEWFRFNQVAVWSAKPGFLILSRVTVAEETQPVSFVREWGNFRSFYTSLGHEDAAFQDANVKKHVTAGILWAARRDHLLE
jgi:type 1 glutamine amidotransferase